MWFQKKTEEVICIGSASKDIFFPTDEGLVIETPEDITSKQKLAFELGGKYRVKERYEAVGGVAANVAIGIARLGHQVSSYSCIGKDALGDFVQAELESAGVSSALLHRLPQGKTDLSAIIVLTQSGERTIFHNRDAGAKLIVEEEELSRAKWIFVSALNGDWQKNLDSIKEAQKKYGFSLAFNPGQHNIKDNSQRIFEALKETEILLLNKDEAIELLAHSSPRPSNTELDREIFLLRRLHEAGAKVIGMTDGKRGAWAYDGQECWHSPIAKIGEVIDTTGAGDAFGSGFFSAFLEGLSLKEALKYGIINSASVVAFYGASEGLLTTEKIKEMLGNVTLQAVTE